MHKEPEHGTRSCYVNRGCRCEPCREAERLYQKPRWKRSNKAKYAKVRELIAELKGRPCKDCGGSFPPECMDFDHLPGFEKKFYISVAISQQGSITPSIQDEITKCDLICANCHRTRTKARGITAR